MREEELRIDNDEISISDDSVSQLSIRMDDSKEVLRIERDGRIFWIQEEMKECKDYKDLAKAFMYALYSLAPHADWRGLAPEIYEEIKHLMDKKESLTEAN